MKRLCVVLVLLTVCSASRADAFGYKDTVYVTNMRAFAIAGVLRKSSEDIVVKLTQSVEIARSEEEALGQFTRKVQKNYPGYAIWDTLVTPLPNKTCETVI